MDMLETLKHLLLLTGEIPLELRGSATLPFAIASGIMGSLVTLLDWLAYETLHRSFLKISHGGWRSLRFILLWALAAALGGYLGAAMNVFQLNRSGAIAAGLAGPLVLSQLKSAVSLEPEDEQA